MPALTPAKVLGRGRTCRCFGWPCCWRFLGPKDGSGWPLRPSPGLGYRRVRSFPGPYGGFRTAASPRFLGPLWGSGWLWKSTQSVLAARPCFSPGRGAMGGDAVSRAVGRVLPGTIAGVDRRQKSAAGAGSKVAADGRTSCSLLGPKQGFGWLPRGFSGLSKAADGCGSTQVRARGCSDPSCARGFGWPCGFSGPGPDPAGDDCRR